MRIMSGQQCAVKTTQFFEWKSELYEYFSLKVSISHEESQVFHTKTITFFEQIGSSLSSSPFGYMKS